MQQINTTNNPNITELPTLPPDGRIVAIDPGTVKHGVAVSDEMCITSRPLRIIRSSNWKNLLETIRNIIEEFDAKALVIGLPLESDGSESDMSFKARDMARKFALSLNIPVYLQDERVSSYEARRRLWASGVKLGHTNTSIDSEAAAVILGDFMDRIMRIKAA